MSDDPYERDQYLHNHRYADSPNCGERLVGNCIATPPAPTEDGLSAPSPITGPVLARAWALSGRSAPLMEPDEWDGFALTVRAVLGSAAPTEDGWDAAMADPAFRESLDEGLADVAAGRTVPHTPAPTEDATLDALRQCERRVAEARAAGYREGLRVSAPITESALAAAGHLDFCSGGEFCSLDDCLCDCHIVKPEPRDPGRKRGY